MSETNQAQTIQRLKDQLKEAKRDLRNNVAKKKLDSNRPEEVDHVERALKIAGQIQATKKGIANGSTPESSAALRSEHEKQFMQGASWMARKAMNEHRAMDDRVDRAMKEFERRGAADDLAGANTVEAQIHNQSYLLNEISNVMTQSKKNLDEHLLQADFGIRTAQANVNLLQRKY